METLKATYLIDNPPSYLRNGLDFKGNIKLLKHPKIVSVIGSRDTTDKGAENTIKLTKYLVDNAYITMSGLALGIDTIVHRETMANNGLTIAVLGTPIDKMYPKENAPLFESISQSGLILSQFPVGSKTLRSNFPQRNRTMAYLSDITIVCDASERSGTRHQVAEALKLKRKVYFLSHIIDIHRIAWAIRAIDKGAKKLNLSELGPQSL